MIPTINTAQKKSCVILTKSMQVNAKGFVDADVRKVFFRFSMRTRFLEEEHEATAMGALIQSAI